MPTEVMPLTAPESEVQVLPAGLPEWRAEVTTDREAIEAFLAGYARHSVHTQRAYRKEITKLWLWLQAFRSAGQRNPQCLFPTVGETDANAYMTFMANPKPLPEALLALGGMRKQPFGTKLEPASIQHALTVLNRFYEVMRNLRGEVGNFVDRNPFVNAHAGKEVSDSFGDQALTKAEWEAVLEAIEQLPQETERERRHYHRARWVFQLLYRTYLRRDEAARLRMDDFFMEGDGEDSWAIRVFGKGKKRSTIIATRRLMSELVIYRRSLGLPPYPRPKENLPAILPVTGWRHDPDGMIRGVENLSNQVIYLLCQEVFRQSADIVELHANGDSNKLRIAHRLREASPHWMRHTGVSHAMESNVSPRFVQAQARHSSLKITARYDHKNRERWRQELEKAGGGERD